jgi:hypothetical protein
VAARERVEEVRERERRVGRVAQRAVLRVRLEGLLERLGAVDHLGELGERREDARGRPPHVVGDEYVRLAALEVGLGAAERADASDVQVKDSKLSLRHRLPRVNPDCAPLCL